MRILAFLKKDFLTESSYRLGFLFNVVGVLASLLGYYFIDRMFGHRMVPHLEEFGVDYFAYVLVGMAFFSYAGAGLGSFAGRIQAEQIEGTLESILLTPTKISTLLLAVGLWNILIATMDVILYLLFGIFVFRIDFSGVNILSTTLILLLTITSFSALGILSAAFVVVFKRGNPLSWLISTLEGILGGVYFPITVLPAWLQYAAKFLPITHAIRALELAVYRGYDVPRLFKEVSYLLLFSLLLLPLSLRLFRHSLKVARRNGTLSQY